MAQHAKRQRVKKGDARKLKCFRAKYSHLSIDENEYEMQWMRLLLSKELYDEKERELV